MSNEPQNAAYYVDAEIVGLRELAPAYFELRVLAPDIARLARPGQFAQLRVGQTGSIDPLLARPISISHADRASGEVSFIFKVVGRGTAMLAERAHNEHMVVLGPIGHPFEIPPAVTHLALVAGGVGMPPLFFLAETLRREYPEMAITLYYGGRTQDDLLLLPEWEALGIARIVLATDDGSRGYHGLITEPLQCDLGQKSIDFLAGCGPRPMLRAVQKLAQAAGIPGQLSLEARMACGVGACLGCVCGTISGHRRVCVDGPVFSLDEVTIDD